MEPRTDESEKETPATEIPSPAASSGIKLGIAMALGTLLGVVLTAIATGIHAGELLALQRQSAAIESIAETMRLDARPLATPGFIPFAWESEANERPNRDSETARLARMALCEHGIENAGAASPCGNCRARAGINVTEALMREGLAAQFEFSGIPPATLKAIIDAHVTDAAFVAATKIGAERITEIVSRFT